MAAGGFNEAFIDDSLPQPKEVNPVYSRAGLNTKQTSEDTEHPSGVPVGRVMGSAKGKGPDGMRPTQLKKLSFPLPLNDFLLQNMAVVLKGVAGREMSVGSWNSTKPRIKGVSCKVSLGLETGSAKSLGGGEHAGFDRRPWQGGRLDQGRRLLYFYSHGRRSHVDSTGSTRNEMLGKTLLPHTAPPPPAVYAAHPLSRTARADERPDPQGPGLAGIGHGKLPQGTRRQDRAP